MSLETHGKVSEYYGKVLKTKMDLKTNACCTLNTVSDFLKKPLSLIADEVLTKFYGCGAPIPYVLKGLKVLDLGSGTGRDCYILSYLVGEEGEVVGIDMTDQQLDIARKHLSSQMEKFNYSSTNVSFHKGYIEDLKSLNLKDNYFDLVISNCVVNLSPDKEAVMNEVFRVLKPGGEFYFSDVYVDRRLPQWAKEDPILLGECLGGALYWKDFEGLAKKVGFKDPRIMTSSTIDLKDQETIDKVGFADFNSITYRLFKIAEMELLNEDFGQKVVYKGTVVESPNNYVLDQKHCFPVNEETAVSSNTARMLKETRLSLHFDLKGDVSEHKGLFDTCGNSFDKINKKSLKENKCC